MRALSLDQPWASLVAEGIKTIETRSWAAPKGLIGERFAVASTARWPTFHCYSTGERSTLGGFGFHPVITDPAFMGGWPTGKRMPRRAQTPTLWWPRALRPHDHSLGTSATEQGSATYAPLGVVLATARLVECLPIIGNCEPPPDGWTGAVVVNLRSDGLWLIRGAEKRRIDEQVPYGDFTPAAGRWAWMLDGIERLGPVPCKGRQRLWEWSP